MTQTATTSPTKSKLGASAESEDEPPSIGALFGRLWARLRGRNGGDSLRESLEELIEEHEANDAPMNPEERHMLLNILSFGELSVRDVMVPRADIVAVDINSPLREVIGLFRREPHSRVPVFRETLDDVVGMVHIKDLLAHLEDEERFDLAFLVRKILPVPPSMPILELLLQMRATRVHMAVVVDEYGGVDGLVTIEDLVEEIVGEIEDEHDIIEGPLLVVREDGVIEADARAEIEELEEHIGLSLLEEDREEDVDTLGGLVFSLVGRVPQRGELISHPLGLEFEVVEADSRRIKRLRIQTGGHASPPADEPN